MKQKYHKRENKPINKSNLTEIVGTRSELEPFVGDVIKCEVFVTNSVGYLGEKRLLTEIRIPGTHYYINHLWVKEHNLPLNQIKHGYQKIELEVIQYRDQLTGASKYGVKIANERTDNTKMVIPKWKLEEIENEKLKAKTKVESPFGKIRRIKKDSKLEAPFGKIRRIKKDSK